MRNMHTVLFALGVMALLLEGCVEEMTVSVADDATSSRRAARLYTPSPDELMEDPSTGLAIAKEIIYLSFRRTTSEATAAEIIAATGGVVVGEDPSSNLYQVRYAGRNLTEIDGIRTKLLSDHPEVEVASRLTVAVHKDPYYVK